MRESICHNLSSQKFYSGKGEIGNYTHRVMVCTSIVNVDINSTSHCTTA